MYIPKGLTADEELYIEQMKLNLDSTHDFAHDEGFKNWLKELTNGILDELFPTDTEEPQNEEALQYLWDHPTRKLNIIRNMLMLFEPQNVDKFLECKAEIPYKNEENKLVEQDNELTHNYYLNNITNLEAIFNLIDTKIGERTPPFKISFDVGFIIEDTVKLEYEYSLPKESNLGKQVPMVITGPSDVKLFKHLVFTTLGDYTSEVHTIQGSRFHYVAIHSMLFQVSKINLLGARFMVPGYDFLVRNKYIKDYGNDYNLCMFYILANVKSEGH